MPKTLSAKDPAESVVIGFDFSCATAGVSSPVVSAVALSGTDPTPGGVLQGAASPSPATPALALQRVHAGVDGVNYGLECTVTTAEGDTLVLAAVLPVRDKARMP